jgi:hypothetical protein
VFFFSTTHSPLSFEADTHHAQSWWEPNWWWRVGTSLQWSESFGEKGLLLAIINASFALPRNRFYVRVNFCEYFLFYSWNSSIFGREEFINEINNRIAADTFVSVNFVKYAAEWEDEILNLVYSLVILWFFHGTIPILSQIYMQTLEMINYVVLSTSEDNKSVRSYHYQLM